MRRAVLLLLFASCSFSAPLGGAPAPDDEPPQEDASVLPVDAAIDSTEPLPDAAEADAAIPPDAPPAFQCPADFVAQTGGEPGSTYKIYGFSTTAQNNLSQSFTAAQATCAAQGAYLAFPNNFSEFDMLNKRIPKRSNAPHFWIGHTDAAVEGTWRTVLNTPTVYVRWGFGEPDGQTSANCVLGFDQGGLDWGMYDGACGSTQPFACECRD